ncbi:hypothetical protein AAF712_007558 [Marasmius tenuissimus]|uniref:Aminotransferase class I/classII large domain-containing protein n=1 Tax=Marasmius tenuissimus TaxID=585030 RepID=A0ABR2ZWE9_9AGAR
MPSSSTTSSTLTLALQRTLDSRARRKILRSLPSPSSPAPTSHPIDFTSNDYLSLTTSPTLHTHVLRTLQHSPHILGSGGSRLLVNPHTHDSFERRVERVFNVSPTTEGRSVILFNSGYDANVSFFSTVPQPGDTVVYDELIHASVHDGMRAGCRAERRVSFGHNDVEDLRGVLRRQQEGMGGTVFVAVESLYSMDGTFAPLREFVDVLEEEMVSRGGDGYLVVDEAHATGVYGPKGRGRVALEGLEGHPRVLARLCTFGKALGGSGALLISTPLITKYLLNYARPLVYTTALSNMVVIAAGCSFDLLEDGTAEELAKKVLSTSKSFTHTLRRRLRGEGVGRDIIRVGVGVGVRRRLREGTTQLRSDHTDLDAPTEREWRNVFTRTRLVVSSPQQVQHSRASDNVADGAQGRRQSQGVFTRWSHEGTSRKVNRRDCRMGSGQGGTRRGRRRNTQSKGRRAYKYEHGRLGQK